MEDYYKILGIGEDATPDQIKAAYRRLAKQHHPDLNKGNTDAEAMFKRVNEANDVLSDPQKRAQYDQQRKFGGVNGGFNPFGQQGFPGGGGGFHFEFGAGGPGGAFDELFNQFFGNQRFRQQQQPVRNSDYQFNLNISMEEAFQGKTMPISFDANGHNKNITVNIPAGIANGTKLRFQGYGDRSHANLAPGDLYVVVMINEHPTFRRDGPHLHANLQLDAIDAMLGTQHTMRTIDGTSISVNVPAGTQHGAVLRVAGQGMQQHHNARRRGDLFISISISIPKDLSPSQVDALKEIKKQRSDAAS